jgi:hypothetical protein
MKWLILCEEAWKLYDKCVATGRWYPYLKHRKFCTECKLEER